MKIFAAGIATETNTFCPTPTRLEDFLIQRGRDIAAGQPSIPSVDLSAVWGPQAKARGDELVFSLMAWAEPSGITQRSTYETLREEILNDLRAAMPVDVVLLMLHGAMVAAGYDDCEEDLIQRVRQVVGPDATLGVELDLHCHLRPSTIAAADLVITYKEYPHVDIHERARELFDLAVRTQLGEIRPTMALFDCRMIGLYPTTASPLREFVDDMMAAERGNEALAISFAHGFQFADVPHVGSKMLVITDNDPAKAERIAREFGMRVYRLRRRIGFDSISLPIDAALSRALAGRKTPVVVADQSDNAGGGAPSDSTFALRWLLERDAKDAGLAIFWDPETVSAAKAAGEGATIPVSLGGKMGAVSGEPVDIEVEVLAIREDYMHEWPQQNGKPLKYPLGDVVALRRGSIDIVVCSRRCQCFSPSVFSDLGVDPRRKQLLIVKSSQHFHGAYAPIAGEVIYMSAPGAVPPDPRRISYTRMDNTRLYPWAEDPIGG